MKCCGRISYSYRTVDAVPATLLFPLCQVVLIRLNAHGGFTGQEELTLLIPHVCK